MALPRPQPLPAWLPLLAALGMLWGTTLWQLSGDWDVFPQYSYGWLVPLLAAYLFYRRWQDRPQPGPPTFHPAATALIFLSLLLLWLPLQLVREANPDWRLVGWVMATLTVALTLSLLTLCGGFSWARHFFMPVGLILIAIPWPTGLEQAVIQTLTRWVASFTVEALTWSGTYATQSGNVILLSTGALGIDEACSGVRSFQSNLMAALVVGEIYRFSTPRRLFLLALALGAGFLLNLARGFILAWIASRDSIGAVQSWHDPAGYGILLVSFALLLLAARVLNSPTPSPVTAPPDAPFPPPRALTWSCAVWLLLVPLITEAWYRSHESSLRALPEWTLDWASSPQATERPIPDSVRSILRYTTATSTQWQQSATGPWYFYEITWAPGRTGAQMARSHTPDICLPAAGARLVATGTPTAHTVRGLRLPIQPYTFQLGPEQIHVFFTLWEQEDGPVPASSVSYYDPSERWRAVVEGRRNRGQKVLHATLTGFPDAGSALNAYRKFLDAHIRVE